MPSYTPVCPVGLVNDVRGGWEYGDLLDGLINDLWLPGVVPRNLISSCWEKIW